MRQWKRSNSLAPPASTSKKITVITSKVEKENTVTSWNDRFYSCTCKHNTLLDKHVEEPKSQFYRSITSARTTASKLTAFLQSLLTFKGGSFQRFYIRGDIPSFISSDHLHLITKVFSADLCKYSLCSNIIQLVSNLFGFIFWNCLSDNFWCTFYKCFSFLQA